MTPHAIPAIDVHAHYGRYLRDESPPLVNQLVSADAATVVARAARVNVRMTIVSPLSGLLPRGMSDAVAGNLEAAVTTSANAALSQWVIAHPLQKATFRQVDEMLGQPQCVGIKIHPEEHVYAIREYGDTLFTIAAKHRAVVLAHSGDGNSLPEDFIDFANAHPDVKLILAHLGNGGGAAGDPTLQVRAIQSCKHGNMYVDTSSARSMMPGLVEWAVREIGSERVLFGTDTPLYSTAMQRARIDFADLPEEDKRNILCDNAARLFPSIWPSS